MGNYASTAELEARFDGDAEVASQTDNEDTGTADTTVLNEVIDNAEGEIDSAVGMRYLVPVDTTDTIVAARMKSITLDLAVWGLHIRGGVAPVPVIEARDAVREWLDLLAEGKRVLPQPATANTTTARETLADWGTAGTTSSSSNRLFSRATQEKW